MENKVTLPKRYRVPLIHLVLGALSGGTYSVFQQVGKAVAKQFLGRFGVQLGLRLAFSFGSFSMNALYDTLYDSWMLKREVGQWPSGKQFMTIYKVNLAINCIGFALDAFRLSMTTKVESAIGEFSSAKSRADYRHMFSQLSKDQKMLERAATTTIRDFDSRMASTVSTISAAVVQKITEEEWEKEMDLGE